jgi:hypothetical protein
MLISLKSTAASRVVYSLAGDVKALNLPRLEQIITTSLHGHDEICFDMAGVLSLDAGVLHFFTEGVGRLAALASPPAALAELRGGQGDAGAPERPSG